MTEGLRSKIFLDLTAELLSRGKSVRLRPHGTSMYPTIREGEVMTVEPVEPCDVKRGDIILYRSERGLIAHRVVGTERKPDAAPTQASVLITESSSLSPHHSLLLKGDASLCCDEPVEAHQILGRVVGVERRGRSIALATRGAKMWHKARRLASCLKGWIYPVGSGSYPNLTDELLSRGATVRFRTSGTSLTQSSVLSPHYSSDREPWQK